MCIQITVRGCLLLPPAGLGLVGLLLVFPEGLAFSPDKGGSFYIKRPFKAECGGPFL